MNRCNFILPVLFFFCFSILNASRVIPLTEISPKGGVAITSVMCINEDDLGFIWFGTNNGLFRYNTHEIKRYSYSQSDSSTISTNRINKILRDSKGQLFIATEDGICKYNPISDNFSRLKITDKLNHPIGTDIITLLETESGQYWMLDERGLAILFPDLNTAEYLQLENTMSRARLLYKDNRDYLWLVFQDGSIYYKSPEVADFVFFANALSGYPRAMYCDDDNIWIGYDQVGLLCFDNGGNLIRHYSSTNDFISDQVRSIIKSHDGSIWVGTYNGIAVVKEHTVIKEIKSDKYPHLPNQSIWSLYKDSNDIIWIGTWLGGLCYYSDFTKSVFHTTNKNANKDKKQFIITSFAQDPDSIHIWIGTEAGTLIKYNTKTNASSLTSVGVGNDMVRNIRAITFDKFDRMWIGTRGDGIVYRDKGKDAFKRLEVPFATGLQALSLLPVDDGVWISDYQQGVFFYSFEEKDFKRYQHNPIDAHSISDKHVRKIIEDSKGNIWFATQNGVNLLRKGSSEFLHFFHKSDITESLAEDYNYSIMEDSQGNIWLGTNGSGLDKLNTSSFKFEHFAKKDGLPGNDIYAILEDRDSNLWLSTDNGICRYSPQKNEVLTFGKIDGIYNNSFNPNSALFSMEGVMFFGGSNGFVRFRPEDILTRNIIEPKTVITGFYINNQQILSGKNEVLSESISYTQSVELNYKQNSFSFDFVATNYIYPDKNKFRYRLKGFSDSWITVENHASATFTNIPPGKYDFEVKASNNDGVWSEVPTAVAITIIPPLWKRWYAFMLYIVFGLIVILYLRNETIKRHDLKTQIELEKVKRESEESIHQVKLQFFTNISHEFRTPLTLILNPLNRLLNNNQFEKPIQTQLNIIRNNSNRLLRLIDQILDFRKIESEKLSLRPVKSDVVAFTQGVFSCFSEHAKHHSFKYTFNTDSPELYIDFDPEKLDKIIFNILSNAFKYSNDGGSIVVSIRRNLYNDTRHQIEGIYVIGDTELKDYVEIVIADEGVGIAQEMLPIIFERFYRLDNAHMQGSGIGLALTKDYIELHHGSLSISSTPDKGTVVCVRIPVSQPSLVEEQSIAMSDQKIKTEQNIECLVSEKSFDGLEMNYQESLVLIVEDNMELLDYLGNLLSDYFKVAKAKNGREGLDQVNSLYPDIIISDVMMPEMDGLELCEKIKSDIQTSHIPIVLLTALETIKDRISGLHAGADAYMPKPFNDQLLLVQIANLLDSRKTLRETFTDSSNNWITKVESMDLDKKLILRASQLVDLNLSNVDFTVDVLASELNLSRTTLHRKLKSLTNQSATEFIRFIRLKKSIDLMKEGKYKINEIGYAVGFNSHNYFTTSFKKQYGISPTEFMKKNALNRG